MLAAMSVTVELPRVGGPGSGLGGPWKVVVLNDDHNTFDHVAETLARVLPGVALADGYRLADRIHNAGLAIVWSGQREDAEDYWDRLDGAGLTMAPLEAG
jgi:ATP-dependent Clp protease adaptor protein ClpS